MTDCLIFSRDRACQLDALLQTIKRYAPILRPIVLWRATDVDYVRGYQRAFELTKLPGLCFDHEGDFRVDTLGWLRIGRDRICFLVDDDLFFAPAPYPDPLPWSWRAADFDYPFSLDGCVYEKDRILGLLDFPFQDPTQLEAGVAWRLANNPRESWLLNHAPEPCLVGVPHNRVSPSSGMPTLGGDPAELNARFLAGDRIDPFATMHGVEVTDTHIDVPYAWVGDHG